MFPDAVSLVAGPLWTGRLLSPGEPIPVDTSVSFRFAGGRIVPVHGRIEARKIWITTELNDYLNFPHVGQAFVIERHCTDKKSGKYSCETAYGITSCSPKEADAQTVLTTNRAHWSIENSCHYIIDWNYDEDRSRIRTGYGPENITRLRRFAIGVIKSKGVSSVAQKMRQLTRNVRLVFDYLKMTKNSCVSAHT